MGTRAAAALAVAPARLEHLEQRQRAAARAHVGQQQLADRGPVVRQRREQREVARRAQLDAHRLAGQQRVVRLERQQPEHPLGTRRQVRVARVAHHAQQRLRHRRHRASAARMRATRRERVHAVDGQAGEEGEHGFRVVAAPKLEDADSRRRARVKILRAAVEAPPSRCTLHGRQRGGGWKAPALNSLTSMWLVAVGLRGCAPAGWTRKHRRTTGRRGMGIP